MSLHVPAPLKFLHVKVRNWRWVGAKSGLHGGEVWRVGRVVPHVAPDLSVDHDEGFDELDDVEENNCSTVVCTPPHFGSH